MKARTTLYADEGMILTDGENFGRIVHLAVSADASTWHEITEEEYEEILARQQEQIERI
jgi:hypothetical protein